jgi:hypothetical protein
MLAHLSANVNTSVCYKYIHLWISISFYCQIYKAGMIVRLSNLLIQQHDVNKLTCHIAMKVVSADSSCSVVFRGAWAYNAPLGVLSGPRLASFRGSQMNALICLSPVNLSFHYHVGQSYRAVWFSSVRIRQTGRFSRQPADVPGARCHSIRKSAQRIANSNTRHKYINIGYGLHFRSFVVVWRKRCQQPACSPPWYALSLLS